MAASSESYNGFRSCMWSPGRIPGKWKILEIKIRGVVSYLRRKSRESQQKCLRIRGHSPLETHIFLVILERKVSRNNVWQISPVIISSLR